VRAAAVVLLVCVHVPVWPALAGELKNSKYSDDFWNFRYALPKLAETVQREATDVIFAGHVPGGVRVEISVRESGEDLSPAKWRDEIKAEWEKKKRKLENVSEPDGRLLFTVKHLGVFDEHHGYRFATRGPQCFLVHAWFGDRTATSGKMIAAALDALALGPDPGSGMRVLKVALQRGKDPLDPAVLLEAGAAYLGEREPIPALAAGVLGRARKLGEFEGEDRFRLFLLGGRAHLALGRHADAIDWLRLAEQTEVADKELTRTAAYELACACSVAGRLDDGFAALRRAFAEGLVVGKGRLSQEKALGNLRKDPRWEKFWMDCVEGK
jgi:hypothetical protein